jgi:N-formylglutamate deformylase
MDFNEEIHCYITIFYLPLYMIQKILHVPHSSEHIPKEFLNDYLIPYEDIVKEASLMKDHFSYELVEGNPNILKFPYSRIFCDVERFSDEREVMNHIGMGVLYTNSHDLKPIRKVKDPFPIMELYYDHHIKFNNLTKSLLDKHGEVLIVDIHSYWNEALPYELYKELKRPDICIGVDYFHYDKKIIDNLIYKINNIGLSYSINEPFKGCIIPSDFYMKDKNVKGVMLEINKKILFDDFNKIKEFIKWTIENI